MAGAVMRTLALIAGIGLLTDQARCDALPDPTRPPQVPAAAPSAPGEQSAAPAYVVQSIVFSPSRRLARVNGQEVRPGSTVGGARVIAIARDAVTLDVAGHRQTIPIHPDVNHDFALNPSAPATPGAKVNPP